MFAIPEIVSLPVLSSLGSGTVLWPTLGGVLAWMLVAAVVGTLLGLLRERGAVSDDRIETDRDATVVSFHVDHSHQEAA